MGELGDDESLPFLRSDTLSDGPLDPMEKIELDVWVNLALEMQYPRQSTPGEMSAEDKRRLLSGTRISTVARRGLSGQLLVEGTADPSAGPASERHGAMSPEADASSATESPTPSPTAAADPSASQTPVADKFVTMNVRPKANGGK